MPKQINVAAIPVPMSKRVQNTVTCLSNELLPTELGTIAYELEHGVDFTSTVLADVEKDALAVYNWVNTQLGKARDDRNGPEFRIASRGVVTDDGPSIFVRIDTVGPNTDEGIQLRTARHSRSAQIAATKERNKQKANSEVTTRELTDAERVEMTA